MSEYQYYEFQAIDNPLNERQMAELRALSTRAEITPTSFTNKYHFGDFRGAPEKVLEKYFDAFFYFANWGTHTLMFRLPAELVNVAELRPYCDGEVVSLKETGKYVLLEFVSQDEGGEFYGEKDPSLASMITLRTDILAGDLRCLYLGWLAGVDYAYRDEDDDSAEPPVPPGMRKRSASLDAFADFMRVDADLLEVATEADAAAAPAEPTEQDLAAWVAALPDAEKNELLVRVAQRQVPLIHAQLQNRFRREFGLSGKTAGVEPTTAALRRTASQLRQEREVRAEENRRKEAERRAREKEKQERKQAKARAAYLDSLARRGEEAWGEVDTLIAATKPKEYDRAVSLLKDLLDLAERSGNPAPARARIWQLREKHHGKPSFRQRLAKAGLNFPDVSACDATKTSVTKKR
jgi:hypothetical protein